MSEAPDLADVVAVGIALLALVVSIWQAMQNRPHLRARSSFDMMAIDDGPPRGPYVIISVANRGSQPTTILLVGVMAYRSWWDYLRRKASKTAVATGGGLFSTTLLPYLLEPGREAKIAIEQTPEFEADWMSDGIKAIYVSHTWGDTEHRAIMRRRRRAVEADRMHDRGTQ